MSDPTIARLAAALADWYRLEHELGAGGMATVYLAHDLKHDRKVAVKVLRPELAAVIGAERFLAEIKTTANLQHPHILPLFDSGQVDSFLFYVMPYIEGETLRDRLRREHQLPIDDVIRIATGVASALDYAHRRGVIHRDIKPENILLHDGEPLVADFGIALAVSTAGTRMTETGLSLGTPHYMSPEQAMGEREITGRTDIYSLGCVVYEMLVAEPPFTGPTAQSIVARVTSEEPRRLVTQRKSVPPQLEAAVFTALEKLPADRFATAAEFASALKQRQSRAGRLPKALQMTASGPSRRMIVGLVVGAVALFVLGAVAERLRAMFATRTPVSFTQETFRQQAIFNARFAPDGKTIVFSAAAEGAVPELFIIRPNFPEPQPLDIKDAHLLSISSKGELAVLLRARYLSYRLFLGTLAQVPLEGGAPRELLDGVREADWSPDDSTLAIIHDVNGQDRLEFPIGKILYEPAGGYVSDPRVSPDGKRVAFVEHPTRYDDRGKVEVIQFTGKNTVLATFESVEGLVWSPSGDELFFSAASGGLHRVVYAVTPSGRLRTVLPAPGSVIAQDVARNGHLLVTRDDERHRLMVRRPGAAEDLDESWLDVSEDPQFSRDGTLMAFSDQASDAGANYAVMLRKSDGGSDAAKLGAGTPWGFSPDGKWVLALVPSTPPQLTLYPTGTGAERRIDSGKLAALSSAAWFPDGKSVLVCGNESGQGSACYGQSLDGGTPRALTPSGTEAGLVSPDGLDVLARNLVTGAYHRYSSATDSGRAIPGLAVGDRVIRWSADGRALYVQRADPFKIDRLDLGTGRRDPLLDLSPKGGSGIVTLSSLAIGDDPRLYAYVARQYLSQLFVVDGVH